MNQRNERSSDGPMLLITRTTREHRWGHMTFVKSGGRSRTRRRSTSSNRAYNNKLPHPTGSSVVQDGPPGPETSAAP